MANIVQGKKDKNVKAINFVLDEFESTFPGAIAHLYRRNSASIRVRIVSKQFNDWSKSSRHDFVWRFLAARLNDQVMADISMLLLLSPKETKTSMANMEFDDPVPSLL